MALTPATSRGLAITYTARSSNTILVAADVGKSFDATAAFTQTLTAAATLGAGWWCIIRNGTSDGTSKLTIDPNGAETIDSLTTLVMYSGDTRILLCDGSNFTTELLEGGFALFTSSGTFTMPSRVSRLSYDLFGAGGSGGAGAGDIAGTSRPAGSGGGGGGRLQGFFPGNVLTAGTGYAATIASTTTSFRSVLVGVGGDGAAGAGLVDASGGAGGGNNLGDVGGTNAAAGGGHIDPTTQYVPQGGEGSCGADSVVKAHGLPADMGGGSGGGVRGDGVAQTTAPLGGTSSRGGGGGGAGGNVLISNAQGAGFAGGKSGTFILVGGSGGGGGAAGGTAGTAGTSSSTDAVAGGGGGGGGANASGVGGVGGAGGVPGGGGGGGGGGLTGGAGGAGGRGEARIWYS